MKSIIAAAAVLAVAASCNKVLTPVIPEGEALEGDCYIGSLKVYVYDPMQGARLYIGDIADEDGTCTVFLPSYDKEGQTIPVLALRNVTMTRKDGKTLYRHGKTDIESGGKVFHFPDGLSGESVEAGDGGVSLVMDYAIQPGKMPFPLKHHFAGSLVLE